MDAQSAVLLSDNPLRDVVFRAGSSMAQQLSGEGGDDVGGSGDVLSSASAAFSEDDAAAQRRRPYSFQQRHRKPS